MKINIKIALIITSTLVFFLSTNANAQLSYTVSYKANTNSASIPGFGNLPSNVLLEGSFTYLAGPNYNDSQTGLYNLLSQTLSINGISALVRNQGLTSSTASALQIGNNDTTLGQISDNIYTFAFIDGNAKLSSDINLLLVSPRFYDLSHSVLSSVDLPLSGSVYFEFPYADMLINYGPAGTGYGNLLSLYDVTFTTREYGITPSIPEPKVYSLLLAGLALVGIAARRN